MDELTAELACKINIDKTEREKFDDIFQKVEVCLQTGIGASELASKVLQMNKLYLQCLFFDEDDERERLINEKLQATTRPGEGVFSVLNNSYEAYRIIREIID